MLYSYSFLKMTSVNDVELITNVEKFRRLYSTILIKLPVWAISIPIRLYTNSDTFLFYYSYTISKFNVDRP